MTPQTPTELNELAPSAATVDRLRSRLATDAEGRGLLDIGYRRVDSPIGSLLVAATSEGVIRIAFELEDHDRVLSTLASSVSPRILESPRRTDLATRQLDEYFAGARHDFELPVDLTLVRGFRREVVESLSTIAYGATASYSEVARRAGRPKAVRAVGTACSHNPIPVVIPCHRVVRRDGTVGQYLGGTEAKVALLTLESGQPPA